MQTRALDPFSRVALCVPFTVLVQPSSAYQLTVDAETAVQQAVSVLIDGDTLILESSAFTTHQQIKVTVGLPASKLSAVTARGTAPVIVSPGFSAAKLTVMAQGTGSLGVLGVNYTKVDVVNSGCVLLHGGNSMGAVAVTAQQRINALQHWGRLRCTPYMCHLPSCISHTICQQQMMHAGRAPL